MKLDRRLLTEGEARRHLGSAVGFGLAAAALALVQAWLLSGAIDAVLRGATRAAVDGSQRGRFDPFARGLDGREVDPGRFSHGVPPFPSCVTTRLIIRSTIWVTSSRVSSLNTITSSIRFRNSGRKLFLSSSVTFSFIFS